MSKTLVIGANGNVGSELARLLAERGETVVHATHRAPTRADQVRVDLTTQDGLETAFAGAQRAFLLVPPGFVKHDELLVPLIEAATRERLRKVVLMTAMGANADDNTPLRKAELALERSGLVWNVIRPNWFMQNFNTFWLHGIRAHGYIALPVGRAKGSFIDARDIAAVAAELLSPSVRTDLENRDFDLTGPEALDHDQVAAILAGASGRKITFQDITPEQMLDNLLSAGLPRPYAEFLILILGFFKAGYAERTTDNVQHITGRAPRRLEHYAYDYRASWST